MIAMTARIPALEPPYEPAVAARLETMMPAGVAPIGLFRTFVRNLPMAAAMHTWGAYELGRQLSVSMRAREIVIDRTTARCGAEYEWGVHVAFFADKAPLTPAEVRSLTHGGPADECWVHACDRVLVELVDQLHDSSDVDDDLWRRLTVEYAPEQVLDLIVLCGWYHAVSFVARAARVEREPFAPTFGSVASPAG
jgi:alkylhydroperoxidase family enzyme